MAGKIKDFQKKIESDADFKETIDGGDYVCEALCFVQMYLPSCNSMSLTFHSLTRERYMCAPVVEFHLSWAGPVSMSPS
jgi:hypothetical protein